MRKIILVIFFVFVLNIVSGFLTFMFPGSGDMDDMEILTDYTPGISYDRGSIEEYDVGIVNVSARKEAESESSLFRIWDFFNLGIIQTLIDIVRVPLFGAIDYLSAFLRPIMNDALGNWLFGPPSLELGILHTVFLVFYSIAAFSLFSGRNPFED